MSKSKLQPGDLFVSPLPNGQFGAIKILRVKQGFHLVGVSKWVGDAPPTASTKGIGELTSGLSTGPMHLRSKFQASWYSGRPPSEMQFITNIPLSEEEMAYETPDCSGDWRPFMAALVLVREKGMSADNLWEMVRASTAPSPLVKYVSPMPLASFWELIANTNPCEDECCRLVEQLSVMNPSVIRSFQERLARLLWALDAPIYANRGGCDSPSTILSPDKFLYQRCWVVGQGRKVYTETTSNPGKMPEANECEDLIAAAPQALGIAEGITGEVDIPTTVSFETYSNNKAWKSQE